jgi:hypothetical protein
MLIGVDEGGGALGAVTVGGGALASSLLQPVNPAAKPQIAASSHCTRQLAMARTLEVASKPTVMDSLPVSMFARISTRLIVNPYS